MNRREHRGVIHFIIATLPLPGNNQLRSHSPNNAINR
jgi:hypothetical protein